MKEHRPLTDKFWEREAEKQQQISIGDYEEWRNHPCTQRLFSDLEEDFVRESALLASFGGDKDQVFSSQRIMYGKGEIIDAIFSWTPKGIDLEESHEA